jgi:hypothetical protein
VLPYLEQSPLAALGNATSGAARRAAIAQILQTPLSTWHCPTRRTVKLYRVDNAIAFVQTPFVTNTLTQSARNDYAINGGENVLGIGQGPDSLAHGDSGGSAFPNWNNSTGISHTRSKITIGAVIDGTSYTYLVGEKYLPVDRYETGVSLGDDQGPYISDERDSMRWAVLSGTYMAPQRDRRGEAGIDSWKFGSAHSVDFQVALCDASVRGVRYTVAEQVHRGLCNRRDGRSPSTD